MILTSKKTKISNSIAALILLCLLFTPALFIYAQSSLSLSVSPTIFDMSANPDQEWVSTVRVVNPNPYELKVFAEVVNFLPDGEAGQGRFVPVIAEESQGQSMAEWVDVTREEIIIPAEQTTELPFTIKIPEDAPPGGHFAAMLIGTKPPDGQPNSQMVTSQIVTSLLFLRVTGDVTESGSIRSFRTSNRLIEKPETKFELRFENKGNVHILPQGEIRITNMWGQERGVIPINRNSLFGNVLPESVRQYNFSWTGEWSIADMGRYRAIASLAYGDQERQFTSSETTFWILPWKLFLLILTIVFGLIWLISWGIKMYIKRMLAIAGVVPGQANYPTAPAKTNRKVSVVAPIEAGMLDLRKRWEEDNGVLEKLKSLLSLISYYKMFFIVLASILVLMSIIYIYVKAVSISERSYNVTIDGSGGSESMSSEEIILQEKKSELITESAKKIDDSLPAIQIINRSGKTGLAADLSLRLEAEGYEIVSIENDLGVSETNTVIVYDPAKSTEAFALSQLVYGALLSAFEAESDDSLITIYVGADLENAVQ